MKKQVLTVMFVALCAGVLLLLFITNQSIDRNPPVIQGLDSPVSYHKEDPESVLLEGVTATDEEDGDVTNSLMIKGIYALSDSEGIVTYIAKDSSNNMVIAKRKIQYEDTAKKEEETVIATENATENNAEEKNTEAENVEADSEQQYEKLREQQVGQNLPYLKLSTHQVTLTQGESFAVQNYIEEAWNQDEDADRHLQINGEIDTDTPGNYSIEVYVTDAEGNRSNIEKLQVSVE